MVNRYYRALPKEKSCKTLFAQLEVLQRSNSLKTGEWEKATSITTLAEKGAQKANKEVNIFSPNKLLRSLPVACFARLPWSADITAFPEQFSCSFLRRF